MVALRWLMMVWLGLFPLACSGNFYEEPEGVFSEEKADADKDKNKKKPLPSLQEELPQGALYKCSRVWKWWQGALGAHYLYGGDVPFDLAGSIHPLSEEERGVRLLTQPSYKNLVHRLVHLWFADLDPEKLVFSQEDVHAFKLLQGKPLASHLAYSKSVPYCEHIAAMGKLYQIRKSDYLDVFQTLLWGHKWDFEQLETYPRHMSEYAAADHLKERVRLHVKLVLIRTWNVFPELSFEQLRRKVQREVARQRRVLKAQSQDALYESFLQVAFKALDQYSRFWSPRAWEHLLLRKKGWLAEVSAKYFPAFSALNSALWRGSWLSFEPLVAPKNRPQIMALSELSSQGKELQKLTTGAGAAVNVAELSAEEFDVMSKGMYDSQLLATVRRSADEQSSGFSYREVTETITRKKLVDFPRKQHHYLLDVMSDDVSSRSLIGVLNVEKFQRMYGSKFSESEDPAALVKHYAFFENLDALVLDLRDHGGGATVQTLELLNLFLEEQVAYYQHHRTEKGTRSLRAIANSGPEGTAFVYLPLVLLVNRFTASSAELIALALRSHGRAIIVGDSFTEGKGTSQVLYGWPLKKGLKLGWQVSIGRHFGVDGASVPNGGLRSDIVIPSLSQAVVEPHEEFYYEQPHVASSSWKLQPGFQLRSAEVLDALRLLSQSRVEQRSDFDFIAHMEQSYREIWDGDISLRYEPQSDEFRLDLLQSPLLGSYPHEYMVSGDGGTYSSDDMVLAEAVRIALDYAFLLYKQQPPQSYELFHSHGSSLVQGWRGGDGLPISPLQ